MQSNPPLLQKLTFKFMPLSLLRSAAFFEELSSAPNHWYAT
jgi:hypothetical protein